MLIIYTGYFLFDVISIKMQSKEDIIKDIGDQGLHHIYMKPCEVGLA